MKHILVVDDDVASCEAAASILHALGHDVEIMADGDVALRRLRAAPPDVVLVGLNIPAMADNAFVVASRQGVRCKTIPVLVMAVTPRAAVDAIRMGARGCIHKPIDAGAVAAAIQPFV
jgi:CheY-like chemotaxis protein